LKKVGAEQFMHGTEGEYKSNWAWKNSCAKRTVKEETEEAKRERKKELMQDCSRVKATTKGDIELL